MSNETINDEKQALISPVLSHGRLEFANCDEITNQVSQNQTQSQPNILRRFQSYVYNSLTSPFSHCIPQHATSIAVRTPYDSFMGNTSYIITVIGSQKVGKSSLCQQLKSFSEDIHSKRSFRNVGVQPDFQLRMKTNSNTYDLGIYDSLGFDDVELLKYLLEGQTKQEENELPKAQVSSSKPGKPKRRKIDSEGFLIVFDVNNLHSFETACQLVREIFNYFSFDPTKNTEGQGRCPVVVFLVGNKTDSATREIPRETIRSFTERQLGGVFYFETSAILNRGVSDLFEELAKKIQEQREWYSFQKLTRSSSFWE